MILTNPPFGGEEEKGIQGNFPEDKQTAETALLFLQLIMRKLRRQADARPRPAVVVPNGTLFGDGVCARIKEELLKEFNLHTIVRLPNGVFAPYTSIPTNLLFFDRSGPTKEVWYYEHPLPEGRKNYTKTQPIQFEEFAPLHRVVEEARGERAGLEGPRDQSRPMAATSTFATPTERVTSRIVLPRSCSTMCSPPRTRSLGSSGRWGHPRPNAAVLPTVESRSWVGVACNSPTSCRWPAIRSLSKLTSSIRTSASKLGRGVFDKPPIEGTRTSAKTLYRIRSRQFIYSRLFAFEGAYAAVPPRCDGRYVSNEFPLLRRR